MKQTKIAALGDSLTKGVILTNKNRYSVADCCFTNILTNELDVFIQNYGKFGCTIDFAQQILSRHSDAISESDYTFIEYGGNDCDFDWPQIADSPEGSHTAKTGLYSFKEQLIDLVENVRRLGSKPVLLSLPPIISGTYFDFFSRSMTEEQKGNIIRWLGGDVGIISRWHETYNRALFMVASQTGIPIIDITTPFDTYRGRLTDLYCPDGIHPNEPGHKLIARTIINEYL